MYPSEIRRKDISMSLKNYNALYVVLAKHVGKRKQKIESTDSTSFTMLYLRMNEK